MPLEAAILAAGLTLSPQEFHGVEIAKHVEENNNAHRLTGYGTLYRALSRLEGQGFVTSHWEDLAIAESERRPRRRLYRVTAAGARALTESPLVPVSTRFGPSWSLS